MINDERLKLSQLESQLSALQPGATQPPWERLVFEAGRGAGIALERQRGRRRLLMTTCASIALTTLLGLHAVQLRGQLQRLTQERNQLRQDLASGISEHPQRVSAQDRNRSALAEARDTVRRMASMSPTLSSQAFATSGRGASSSLQALQQLLLGEIDQLTAAASPQDSGRVSHEPNEDLETSTKGRREIEREWLRAATWEGRNAS